MHSIDERRREERAVVMAAMAKMNLRQIELLAALARLLVSQEVKACH